MYYDSFYVCTRVFYKGVLSLSSWWFIMTPSFCVMHTACFVCVCGYRSSVTFPVGRSLMLLFSSTQLSAEVNLCHPNTHRHTRECAFSASVAEWVNLQSVLMLCDSEGWLQRQDTRRQQRPHKTHTNTSHPDLQPSLPWPAQHHLFQNFLFLMHKSLCWHITCVKDKYMGSVDPARSGSCQRQTEKNRNTKDIY